MPAQAISWRRIPRDEATTDGELRLRIALPDGDHVTLSHVCDWSDCEAAGRGTADRSVPVMLDVDTGAWAIVHTGQARSWSAQL